MSTTNIKEVARRASVSVGTVSNFLNRPDVVAPATRKRIAAAIRELGFVRNEAARHLRAGRSRTIGLIVLDVTNPFFTDLASGAEELADKHDTMVVLCNSGEDPDREARHLDQLEERRALGVLITPTDAGNPRLTQLAERGMPVVLVDSSSNSAQCSVAVDDVRGGYLAGTHLLEHGHRHIAFIGDPGSIQQVKDRHQGLESALDSAGGDVELTVIATSSLSVTDGRMAGAKVADMRRPNRPTAALCANDIQALGFLQEMTRRGIGVPDEMAIVGYDGIDFSAAAAVPLSTVRQPRDSLGRTAIELLFEEVEHPNSHQHRQVLFQPALVVRDSSSLKRTRH